MAVLAIEAIFRGVMRVNHGHKFPAGDHLKYIPLWEGAPGGMKNVYMGREFPC
jgi:hypothetical protein